MLDFVFLSIHRMRSHADTLMLRSLTRLDLS